MSPPKAPRLNLTVIDFPSDRITFGQIRRYEPDLLDEGNILKSDLSALDVIAIHYIEQNWARKVFAKAAGLPDPEPGMARQDTVDELNRAYKEYGISSGLNETRELVRRFESAAAAQGRAAGGPGL